MDIMSTSEAAAQLGMTELGRHIDLHGSGPLKSKSYYLPSAAADQTILARSIGAIVANTGSCWLQITYWSNDADSNQELFYGYRKGLGEKRSLADASVHKFDPGENSHIASILSMVIYFGWDARIFDSAFTYELRVNNDGFLDLESTNAFGQLVDHELTLLGLSEMAAA